MEEYRKIQKAKWEKERKEKERRDREKKKHEEEKKRREYEKQRLEQLKRDEEIANKLKAEEEERRKQLLREQEEKDMELARKLYEEEINSENYEPEEEDEIEHHPQRVERLVQQPQNPFSFLNFPQFGSRQGNNRGNFQTVTTTTNNGVTTTTTTGPNGTFTTTTTGNNQNNMNSNLFNIMRPNGNSNNNRNRTSHFSNSGSLNNPFDVFSNFNETNLLDEFGDDEDDFFGDRVNNRNRPRGLFPFMSMPFGGFTGGNFIIPNGRRFEDLSYEELQRMFPSGNRWVGANKEVINQHSQDFVVKDLKKDLGDNKNCVICLCDFEKGDKCRRLNCFHVFHKDCVDEWLKSNAVCPICKEKITTTYEEKEEEEKKKREMQRNNHNRRNNSRREANDIYNSLYM